MIPTSNLDVCYTSARIDQVCLGVAGTETEECEGVDRFELSTSWKPRHFLLLDSLQIKP